ncbi:MAG: hypothetical protein JST82_15700 [Bacteroidetes bacterium]|nr:hypothetical protein [Bacteroidota bacterium]
MQRKNKEQLLMLKRLSTARTLFVDKTGIKAFLLAFCTTVFVGCGNEVKAPDVSDVKAEVTSRALYLDIAKIDTNAIGAGLQQLKTQYPDFLDFYLDTLIGLDIRGNYNDTVAGIRLGMKSFLTNKDYRGLLDTVAKHYPDTKKVDEQLEKGFQYMKHYFPSFKEPKVIYVVSWLGNIGAFTCGENTLGIGVDMFLGPQYPYYKSVGIPEYWSEQLQPDYIQVAVFKTLYRNMHPFIPDNRNLLDMMIQRGKEAYFVDMMLPEVSEATKMAYTTKQLKWCADNEGKVYNFFIVQNFLYETNWQKILRYVNEGPNSTGMGDDSPGNIGAWMGLQIVKAYMEQHPKMTLAELLSSQIPAQQFLQESKYKPK